MGMGLMLFIAAAIIVAAFMLSFYFRRRTIDSMRRVAAELGYEFVEGGSMPAGMPAPDDPTAQAVLSKLTKFLASWDIRGQANGFPVRLYTLTRSTGKNSTTYTVAEMGHGDSRSGDFSIAREGIFSKLGKALGGQDIEAGDPAFDAKARVKGSDPQAVMAMLASAPLRQAILGALEAYPELVVSADKIRLERAGVITRTEFFRALIAAMSGIASEMAE